MDIESLAKILHSALLGGIIGLEREWFRIEAGLRTSTLIAMGSTLLTLLSQHMTEFGKSGDPGRLTAQIVIGIGLIGAGAVIQARRTAHGLTTAATFWIVAAIGISVGIGQHLLAFAVTFLTVLALGLIHIISRRLEKGRKSFSYTIRTVEHAGVLGEIKKILHELAISCESARISKGREGYEIDILITSSEEKNRDFLNQVMQLQQVSEISNENL